MLKKPKNKARVLRGGNQLRADPTRTTTLRKMFMRAFSVRMDRLKSAIWQLVAEEDAFGLSKSNPLTFNYNPSQPRDNRGRWTSGGTGGFSSLSGQVQETIATTWWDSINPALREDSWRGNSLYERNVKTADELFAQHGLSVAEKTTVYRGVDKAVYPTEIGSQFIEKGFLRTSTDKYQAEQFSARKGKSGQILRLDLSEGDIVLPGDHVREGEVYHPRNTKIEVTHVEKVENGQDVFGNWHRIDIIHARIVREGKKGGLVANRSAITMLMLEDQTLRNRMSDIQALLEPEDVIDLETEPHITVRYGLKDLTFQQVRTLLRNSPQVWLKLGRLSLFQNADADVLKIEVHSEELHKINRRLRNLDEGNQTHKTYSPHITVAFLKPGTGYKYIHSLPNPFYGIDVLFKTLTYSSSGKEVTEVLLNTRWKFNTTTDQVRQFQQWLQQRFTQDIVDEALQDIENAYWYQFIAEAYQKGAGKSFDDVNRQHLRGDKKQLDFYKGTRKEFLRNTFAQPVQIERVKTLAGRVLTELTGVTQAMSVSMSRILLDGLAQGKSPREVARELNTTVDKIGRNRALTIARTETIRAHAEGQLDSLTNLGIEAVGVAVEWDTTGDGRVCPLCQPLDGIVLKVEEARGMLPRHPNCRCSWIPANVGESGEKQKKRASDIKQARDASILAEIPKDSKRTILEQKKRTSWGGADTKFAPKRPKSILD